MYSQMCSLFLFWHISFILTCFLLSLLRSFLHLISFLKTMVLFSNRNPGENQRDPSGSVPGVMRWFFLCLIGLGSGLVAVSVDAAIDYVAGQDYIRCLEPNRQCLLEKLGWSLQELWFVRLITHNMCFNHSNSNNYNS